MDSELLTNTEEIDVQEDDSILVAETLKNPEAFGKIMNKYSAKLTRYIYRIAGSTSFEVDDLLQNVFIKVYKNLNNFDSSLSFSSWIYRITHNEVIDYVRKMKIRPKTASSEEEEDFFLNVADGGTDLLEESHTKMLKGQIEKVLLKMKEKYRAVLTLKYLEDKDYNEISDILKIPLGTVATLMHRAKIEFKKVAEGHNLNIKDL